MATAGSGTDRNVEGLRMRTDTYRFALLTAVTCGFGIYIAIAAGPNASAYTAIPYGVAAVVAGAFFLCALVAYKRR